MTICRQSFYVWGLLHCAFSETLSLLSFQALAIKEQLKVKMEALKRELESKRKGSRHDHDQNGAASSNGNNDNNAPTLSSRFESVNI